MRISKVNDNVSFQAVKVDAKAKKAMISLIDATSDEAVPCVKNLLQGFKERLVFFDNILQSDELTKGMDVVLTETADEATNWGDTAVLILKNGKNKQSRNLYLYNLRTFPYDKELQSPKFGDEAINNKFKLMFDEANRWFDESLTKIREASLLKKEESPKDFINNLFG